MTKDPPIRSQCLWARNLATAAAAKSLHSCLTLCDPQMAAHQAPPSLGFSRQEHWSGWKLTLLYVKLCFFFFFFLVQEMSCIHMASKYANTKHVMKIL